MYDVIVIGGSYAGLAATLQLGRARRDVLVVDSGARRNRYAAHAHGFLGQEGQPPGVIAARGREEVLAYPTVTWREAEVTEARAIPGGFSVRAGAETYRAKRIILATGVVDELPELPGLAERWGSTVFHCPYCHGYELNEGRIGVLASSPLAAHLAPLASEWSAAGQTTLFLNDLSLEPQQEAELIASGVRLERARVVRVSGEAPLLDVELDDGRTSQLDGLFVQSWMRIHSSFAQQLGCAIETGPQGETYQADPLTRETNVPGVFACGDAALPMGSVTFAVADGARAGIGAHRSLVFRGEPRRRAS